MAKRFNEPNHSFIIETKTKGGEHLCYWRIDQAIPTSNGEQGLQRVENQVARHLGHTATRLGLVLWITLSGPIDTVDAIIKNSNYEIS